VRIFSFQCPVFGKVQVESKDIEYLFSIYRGIYKETFSLNTKELNKMHKFKSNRGGALIEVKNQDKILGLFTLSLAKSNFLELGDLMKLEKTFPRESYAKAMKEACIFSIKEKKKKGVYSYPNRYGINLEKMAGFKEYSFYVKRVSFVLFNNTFLLPIEIYQRRIHICKTFFKQRIFRRNLKLLPTRLSKFKLSIFQKDPKPSEIKKEESVKLGFLYEFIPSKNYGDPFMVFEDTKFDLKDIGFEFCDNSA